MKRTIYIVVEAESDIVDDYGDLSAPIDIRTKEMNIEELLSDPEFSQELIDRGWLNARPAKGIEEEGIGPRTYLLSSYHGTGSVNGKLVDLQNPNTLGFDHYSINGSVVAVEVGLATLKKVAPESHAILKQQIEATNRANKARAAAETKRRIKSELQRKKTEEKRAIKALENARKLLESKGLKVGE